MVVQEAQSCTHTRQEFTCFHWREVILATLHELPPTFSSISNISLKREYFQDSSALEMSERALGILYYAIKRYEVSIGYLSVYILTNSVLTTQKSTRI